MIIEVISIKKDILVEASGSSDIISHSGYIKDGIFVDKSGNPILPVDLDMDTINNLINIFNRQVDNDRGDVASDSDSAYQGSNNTASNQSSSSNQNNSSSPTSTDQDDQDTQQSSSDTSEQDADEENNTSPADSNSKSTSSQQDSDYDDCIYVDDSTGIEYEYRNGKYVKLKRKRN